ncbi:cold-shock protein [Pseudoduganella sp. HUAS MS19]
MNGTIKYFNANRGFGFIVVPGESDIFFHISALNGDDTPNTGDLASFKIGTGKDGRKSAIDVKITARKSVRPNSPYYGKPTFRAVAAETPVAQTLTGAGIFGAIGLLIGGPIGGVLGAGVGSILAENKKQEEITSPCIKCGGVGSTTATVGTQTGFQCKNCHHFWRVRTAK